MNKQVNKRVKTICCSALVALLAVTCAVPASAEYADCKRYVEAVYPSVAKGQDQVWVCMKHDMGCVMRDSSNTSEAVLNRMMSMAQSAMLTGKPLFVRYENRESRQDCPLANTQGFSTNISGIWLDTPHWLSHQ